MASVMTVVRADALRRAVEKESNRILESFAVMPDSKHRASIKVVRRLLITGPHFLNGKMWDVKSKSLGAGIYELSLKEAK